jgi:ABC-type transport system substrate-binding protein
MADNPLIGKAMLSVADYWQQLGVAVDPVVIPTQRASDREYQATFPAFMFRRQPNATLDLLNLHGSQTPLPSNNYVGRNYARYMNPEFDALIDMVFATVPRAERMQALRATMHHISDQLVRMGLFYDASSVLVTSRLQGVTVEAQGWNAHDWTLGG